MELIKMFETFLADCENHEMFITGGAGTGKTYNTKHLLDYIKAQNISYIVCAFTHTACDVLKERLGGSVNVETLHKYLKKRPTLNQHAKQRNHLNVNVVSGLSEVYDLVLLDEFSMVGDRDIESLRVSHQTNKPVKVVYIGDKNQIPAVGDKSSLKPKKPYWFKLTKSHRTTKQDILDAMENLVCGIEGGELNSINTSTNIIRGCDIVKGYKDDVTESKLLLAWTNNRVQILNTLVKGRSTPSNGDTLTCVTLKTEFKLVKLLPPNSITSILKPDKKELKTNSKFKTLEYLKKVSYINFLETGSGLVLAYVFGHGSYNKKLKQLQDKAIKTNNDIPCTDSTPAHWAACNPQHKLSKIRKEAWRELLVFKECVMCVDFPSAKTVHKAQGATYKHVYIDTKDLAKCANRNYKLYLQLFYVALSRASEKVYTN